MRVKGAFTVDLVPQEDEVTPAGCMRMEKSYNGSLEGEGKGQMISKRLDNGTAAYFAIEEFTGSLTGKNGSFTLLHRGFLNKESQTLEITILEGSGTGELKTISGTMNIEQEDDQHFYELTFKL